jgi:Tfp pilus assembly protein PilV
MGKLMLKRIKSVTLIETIIAMVIIVTVTALTTLIFVQVMGSGNSMSRLKAIMLCEKYLNLTQEQQLFFDEDLKEEGYVVQKRVAADDNNSRVLTITITVNDKLNRIIKKQSTIVVKK